MPPFPNSFSSNREILANYDFTDVLRGHVFETVYCSAAFPKATVYESYITGDDTDNIPTSTTFFAQTFTIGTTGTDEDFWCHGVELFIDGSGANSSMTVSIQAVDGSNKPDGIDLTFGSFIHDLNTTPHFHRMSFSKPAKLSSATQYAIVVIGNNSDRWRSDNSSPTYPGGEFGTSTDSGATWTMDANKDFLFKVLGDTIPSLTFFQRDLQNADSFQTDDPAGAGPVNYTQQFTQDIAMIIGKSTNLQGPLIFQVPINVATMGSNNQVDFYYNFELVKNSGGTETSIGTSSSKATSATTTGTTNFLSRIDIGTIAHFKENDELILRVTFFMKVNDTSSTGAEFKIEFKDIWMDIPFKTDII